jgi:hypothetical protein
MAEVIFTSETGGSKGRKDEMYSLIPVYPLAELARVYAYGCQKYAPDNWRKGYPYSWSIDSLQRHIEKWRAGEEMDDESGLPHLCHAMFHLMTLREFEITNTGTDDRYCSKRVVK